MFDKTTTYDVYIKTRYEFGVRDKIKDSPLMGEYCGGIKKKKAYVDSQDVYMKCFIGLGMCNERKTP